MVEALQQVKSLSESKAALQQELGELKVTAQAVVDIVEIPVDNAEEPLSLAGKLQKVPQCFLQCVSVTTRQSYWPQTPLDPLGEGVKSYCIDDQFDQYLLKSHPLRIG
jgi:hypothetical protein